MRMGLQIVPCTGCQTCLFAPVHAFSRTAEAVLAAVSYLNKDQAVCIP
jgi:hypothetical protein